jgi:hypothetical protein
VSGGSKVVEGENELGIFACLLTFEQNLAATPIRSSCLFSLLVEPFFITCADKCFMLFLAL